MKDSRKTQRKQTPYRRSRQRERILELLRSTDSHPTANWLFGKLRKEFPDLSLGTIYRNIGILIQQGPVSREEIIEKSISHFRSADKDLGDRLTKAVKALRQHA